MANTNSPFGFSYMGPNRGGPAVTGGPIERKIAAANNTPICKGDLVQSLSTGYVAISAAGVAVSQAAGIFVGCRYLSTARGQWVYASYWPNGDHAVDGYAEIIPIVGAAPQLFKVQATSTNFTFADIGANCDISVGSQSIAGGFGLSGMTLDRGTIGTTATLPFRIVDMYSAVSPGAPGTDDTSNYNIVIVQSNPAGETGIN
jgi:hypothetical protein